VRPSGPFVWGGWYEPGTLVWRGRFVDEANAIVECRDALALPATGRRAIVLRRLIGLSGRMAIDVTLEASSGFGTEPLRELARAPAGGWHARTGAVRVGWWGADDARVDAEAGRTTLRHVLELSEGETRDLVLVLSCDDDEEPPDPDLCWASTENGWKERVPTLGLALAERDSRHAWAVLSGLTSSGGGMVAAATMGLPERANEGRSYDYRYVWIRDQAYAARAAVRGGGLTLLDAAVRFTRDRLLDDGKHLTPAYTTSGDPIPAERPLELPGYPGGVNVVGNHVRDQFQLDVFGEALLLLAEAARHDRLDAETWHAAEIAARAIENRWQEPDAGIWELGPDHWTVSRLLCAAGLRAIAAAGPAGEQSAGWLALADTIVADTASRAVHRSGRWQRSPTDRRIDAALLLPALRGAVPADDPRSVATLEAVLEELSEDGYVYRFRPDSRPLGEAEGAFLLCGFLASLALLQRGDTVASARWFERTRAACGPPGLLSEEFDVRQRQLRGNLPQAFVHAELLECALAQAEGAL
jgi:alpha,alpha-trehalase